MIQWAIVAAYILVMFVFTRQDVSSAGYTAQLLARWFPQLSSAELRQLVWLLRKAGHVLAYAVLTLLVYSASRSTKRLRGRALIIAVLTALLVAAADESYQRRLQHRSGAWMDVLIDSLGTAAVAAALGLRSSARKKHREVVEKDAEN